MARAATSNGPWSVIWSSPQKSSADCFPKRTFASATGAFTINTSLHKPAGIVSGDYCDLIRSPNDRGKLIFLLGDVAGKGVAASLLMTLLHAMFRSLASLDLELHKLLEVANRPHCECTIGGQYATVVCGRALGDGRDRTSKRGPCSRPSGITLRSEPDPLHRTAVGNVFDQLLQGESVPAGTARYFAFVYRRHVGNARSLRQRIWDWRPFACGRRPPWLALEGTGRRLRRRDR